MNFDIGISYLEDMPEELVLELARDLREAELNVAVEKRPNVPFAAFEWAIPAAIMLYFGKPYIDGLLKEAAKEHYPIYKEKLAKFAHKVLRIKQRRVVSSQSPNKLREDNPVSNSFAIQLQTVDRRPIKFLFLGDREEDYYQSCMDEVFNLLLNHAREYPNDYLSKQADRLPRGSREIYMLFDESSKNWKAVDVVTGQLVDGGDAI